MIYKLLQLGHSGAVMVCCYYLSQGNETVLGHILWGIIGAVNLWLLIQRDEDVK